LDRRPGRFARWVITNELARASRPGYGGERGTPASQVQVDRWIDDVKASGMKSVICLLGDDQLGLYDSLPGGLVGYYRGAGFDVAHIPVRDHQKPPVTDGDLEKIWEAYQALPKPVLVHCSAGVDRTGRAIDHIRERLAR